MYVCNFLLFPLEIKKIRSVEFYLPGFRYESIIFETAMLYEWKRSN